MLRKLNLTLDWFYSFFTRLLFRFRYFGCFNWCWSLCNSLWFPRSFWLLNLWDVWIYRSLINCRNFRWFSRSLGFHRLLDNFLLCWNWFGWFRFASSFWFFHYWWFNNFFHDNFFLLSRFSCLFLIFLQNVRFNFFFLHGLFLSLFFWFYIILISR